MNGKWKIGSTDLYTSLGVLILKGGYSEVLSPPEPKKRLEYDYQDKDGVDVDKVSNVVYQAKRFKMSFAITASSSSQFWSRYNALLALVDIAGEFALNLIDLGVTVNLLYEGAKCINKSRSLKSGPVVVIYEMSFLEADPTNRTYA